MKNNTVYEYIQGSSKAVKKHLKELRCKNPGFSYLALGSEDAFIDDTKYKNLD
ncbi:hypothetical protein [Agathobacter rectalis]|jgi:hypothetical protein|uniref:hypothetical protein n=1 Tax=Agathobacter rectalis TaxID=39491 RepID=UPI0027DCF3BD|nr:hypothetical protein [Agathobacter rectalis]